MDELRLIQQIGQGDQKAFNTFYSLYYRQVYRTAFGYFRNQNDAEDLTQDAFITVLRAASRFRTESSVSTWLYRVTVNRCLDRIRFAKARKRLRILSSIIFEEQPGLEESIAENHTAETELEQKDANRVIRAALNRLPESQRTAFVLTQVESLTGKQTAEVMGIHIKAVESLIQRAKANLRKYLNNYYHDRRF